MHTNRFATSVIVLSGLLLGCEKHPGENTSQSPPPAIVQTAPAVSAAVPSVDPSLPPVDAATSKPKTGTDATADSTLTQTERDSKMPLPGQVNDHSSPDVAKRGDNTAPAKAAK